MLLTPSWPVLRLLTMVIFKEVVTKARNPFSQLCENSAKSYSLLISYDEIIDEITPVV